MRLKKMTEELKSALDADAGKKKRARKIGKIVDELGKKKKKYEAKKKNAAGVEKKLAQKIEVCDSEIAKGREALKKKSTTPVSASAVPTAKVDALKSSKPATAAPAATDKSAKTEKKQDKSAPTTRSAPH